MNDLQQNNTQSEMTEKAVWECPKLLEYDVNLDTRNGIKSGGDGIKKS